MEDLEDILEQGFWRFDALHKPNYRDVSPDLVGPMSERDAFKSTVRWIVNDMLGKHAISDLRPTQAIPERSEKGESK